MFTMKLPFRVDGHGVMRLVLGQRKPHIRMLDGEWRATWGAHHGTGPTPKIAYRHCRLQKNWADQERDRRDLEEAIRPSIMDRLRELPPGTQPSVKFRAEGLKDYFTARHH